MSTRLFFILYDVLLVVAFALAVVNYWLKRKWRNRKHG